MPFGYEPEVQLVLPYVGLFAYSIGRQSWLIDASKILLIQPGWEFADEQAVEGLGHASLLVNPAQAVVDELLGCGSRQNGGTSFGPAQSSPKLWLLTQYFLAEAEGFTNLEADEWLIQVVELASDRPRTVSRPSARTVARAKEFLHAHGYDRVSLERVANAVGVSPVYLTQEFTRSEGVPLYQYQLCLRLIRSLQQLRDCEDITQLALELGFSSHSHFSEKFRRTFGLSPSAYRHAVRSRRSFDPDMKLSQVRRARRAC
jgi:AraC-like DNA-binding protein